MRPPTALRDPLLTARPVVASRLAAYVCPLAAGATSVIAFFAAGRLDPTPVRLGFEIFGVAAFTGALWPRLPGRSAILMFAAVGLLLTGAQALQTSGAWCWLGAGLAGIGVVDAHHVAHQDGDTLAPWPTGGAVAAMTVAGMSLVLLA